MQAKTKVRLLDIWAKMLIENLSLNNVNLLIPFIGDPRCRD